MKLYLIDKLTCFISTERISEFHYDMFHGLCKRGQVHDINAPTAFLTNEVREPLAILRNGRIVPPVFAPSSNFVVSANVSKVLQRFLNVSFLSVRFEKLIDYEFRAGDMSWYDHRECDNPDDLFKLLRDVPEYHESIGEYYEILTPRLQDIAHEFNNLRQLSVPIGPTKHDPPLEFAISPGLLEKYPIIWEFGVHLFNEPAFEVVQNYIDWDYFIKAEAEL